ncbi:MAG: HAMP domain-containing histidine kinase [Bacteroidales bacterium]|jgi:signal transduction histidine kinase|nr:HAMP domain-containing histidine kinase [Bacteroidales bacterium]
MKIFNGLRLIKRENHTKKEREKLLQHISTLQEGICFFSSDKKVEFNNDLYIRYIETITKRTSNPLAVFYDEAFNELHDFLSRPYGKGDSFYTQINRQGKIFSLSLNIFEDDSFEIILNDITTAEDKQKLKRELTGNIAHELRTPVASIRGYLETLLNQSLNEEQRQHFLTRAYESTLTLSELISDMTLLTKIDDAPHTFKQEIFSLNGIITDLKKEVSAVLQEKKIDMQSDIGDEVLIKANRTLVYSVFRNLTDNAIRYAGENILIRISKYKEDEKFYYFSFSDTGVGIKDESHLNRLFERFYRLNEGRTRDSGGSGLGLSIVRNAIALHGGFILAKNRVEGGLEFLFSLPKGILH